MARLKDARRGRPPASSAGDTRQRIISVASQLFSDLGYGVTTNKDVALLAGISTGALYYYFESKLDMYMAVFRAQQSTIDARMQQVMDSETTFHGRLRGILEAAHELNVDDPYLARFQSTARVDRQRHAELRKVIPNPPGEGAGLMARLIDEGIGTEEIDPAHRERVAAVVRVVFVGLVDSASSDPMVHQVAVEGLTALFDGDLLRRPRTHPTGPVAAPEPAEDHGGS